MRGRVADTAPEKINLWETSKISKITRHSFKHINCVKLQYIMLDPPQLFCLLALRAICVITPPTHSGQGYTPAYFMAAHFPAV